MRKFILVFLFLFITPINLAIGLLSLINKNSQPAFSPSFVSSQLYAALLQESGEVLGTFETADARPTIIRKYLEKYNSPIGSDTAHSFPSRI